MSTPSRPTIYDDNVLTVAAEILLPEYARWGEVTDENVFPYLIASLKRAIRGHSDAHKIVRELELYDSIDGDQELVDIMGQASSFVDDALKVAEWLWVVVNQIKPEFSIGDRVILRGKKKGTIVQVLADVGRYHVRTDDQKPTAAHIARYDEVAADEDALADA